MHVKKGKEYIVKMLEFREVKILPLQIQRKMSFTLTDASRS